MNNIDSISFLFGFFAFFSFFAFVILYFSFICFLDKKGYIKHKHKKDDNQKNGDKDEK